MKIARRRLWVVLLGILALGLCGCGGTTSTTAAETTTGTGSTTSTESPSASTTVPAAKIPKLVLIAPPGPMTIPMAYLAANNKLAAVAEQTELVMWENADQLKAMVAGGQGHFVTMPSNNSAIFYNRGLTLKLLDISVWNISYLISTDPAVQQLTDLGGKTVIVSLKGSVPDVMFRTMLKRAGLDPEKDVAITYVSDPTQAAQMFLAGKAENVVLSEAVASSVILKTKDAARPARRVLDFGSAWASLFGEGVQTPIAGTCATSLVLDRPDVIKEFLARYEEAVAWTKANPQEGGALVEKQLPELGLTAALMGESAKNIAWQFVAASEARSDIENFFNELATLSPEVIGGKLPDDGYYYQP